MSGLYWEGDGKKTASPAFGFRLSASGMDLMVGMHGFAKEALAAYREAVADEGLGNDLARVVADVRKQPGYTVGGEHYKKVPRGFDPDHLRAGLLRYNALYAYPPGFSPAETRTPAIVDQCYKRLARLAPVYQWLKKALEDQR